MFVRLASFGLRLILKITDQKALLEYDISRLVRRWFSFGVTSSLRSGCWFTV